MVRRWIVLCALACAAPQRPAVFADLEQLRRAPSAERTAELAPQSHARALELEQQALAAWARDDKAGGQWLAEQALAEHEKAWALTRLAEADGRGRSASEAQAQAQGELDRLKGVLRELEKERAAVQVELDAARALNLNNARRLGMTERELADLRAKGAKALSAQAAVLCAGASLLGAMPANSPLPAQVAALRERVNRQPEAELGAAAQLRSACEALLEQQPPAGASRPSAQADRLLSDLARAGWSPGREAWGVKVVGRDWFDRAGVWSEVGRKKVAELADVARTHPEFPILVVAHSGAANAPRGAQSAARVQAALKEHGVRDVAPVELADHQPIAPPGAPWAPARNERVEIVFVTGGS